MKNIIVKILIIGIATLALSSCSSFRNHGQSGTQIAPEATETGGATTSGAAAQSQFSGSANAIAANKLRAPANQVYHFGFDKDIVQQDDVASIQAQADYLVRHNSARVRIDGNTDERGSREYNIALGWRRAKAVASMLEQDGVDPQQIVTNSYGQEKPFAFGHDEESYKLNRRGDLTYEAK